VGENLEEMFLFDTKKELREMIKRVLEKDTSMKIPEGDKIALFGWDITVRKTEGIYRKILKKPKNMQNQNI